MQTSAVAQRITAAAHAASRRIAKTTNQIVIEDLRIKDWTRTAVGAETVCYDFAIALLSNGRVLRVRTLSTGLLDVAYATPGATMTWTTLGAGNYGGTIPDATVGNGVAIYASGATVDIFWVDADGVTIKTAQSADYGGNFGAPVAVATLSAQPNGACIKLTAPASNIVFFTDSTPAGTRIGYSKYSGAWGTATYWDLDCLSIGVHATIPVFGGGNRYGTLAGYAVGSNFLFAFHANRPRGIANSGIFTVWAYATDTGYQWGDPSPVYANTLQQVKQANETTAVGLFCTLPKICYIGSEYWLIGIESSLSAGNTTNHLAVFASSDGIHWRERAYHAVGTDLEYTASGLTAFVLNDFIGGQMCVSGSYLYLLGYDTAFRAAATQICGIDNSDKKLDLTAHVPRWSISRPQAGQAATSTITLNNPRKMYNGNALIDGARVTHKTGYMTQSAGATVTISIASPAVVSWTAHGLAIGDCVYFATTGALPTGITAGTPYYIITAGFGADNFQISATPGGAAVNTSGTQSGTHTGYAYLPETVTVLTGELDEIEQAEDTAPSSQITLKIADYIETRLERWIPDTFYEFLSPKQIALKQFDNMTTFAVLNGALYTSGGTLYPTPIDPTQTHYDNLAVLTNTGKVRDGILEFKFTLAASIADSYCGIAFGVKDAANYYALLFNKAGDSKFQIYQATATATGSAKKLAYTAIDVASDAILLALNGAYWMRVQQFHNRVVGYWASAMGAPVPKSCSAAAGGSLDASTTYYYKITAIDGLTSEETQGSEEIYGVTTVPNKKLTLEWNAVPGAAQYKIYRSTTSGTYDASCYLATVSAPTVTYTDDGTVSLTSGTPPTTSLDTRKVWQKVIDYSGVSTDGGLWGIIDTGAISDSDPVGETRGPTSGQQWLTLNEPSTTANPLGPGIREHGFIRITLSAPATLRSINARIWKYVDAPTNQLYKPPVALAIVKDNGAGTQPADLSVGENILYSESQVTVAIPTSITPDGTVITVRPLSLITLDPGLYWLWCSSTYNITPASLMDTLNPNLLMGRAGGNSDYPTRCIYNNTLTGFVAVTNQSYLMWITLGVQTNGFSILALNFCSGGAQRTIEHIAHAIAARAGMNGVAVDNYLNDAFASLDIGADGSDYDWANNQTGAWAVGSGLLSGYHSTGTSYAFIRNNSSLGTRGDAPFYFDLKLVTDSVKAGALVRALGSPTDGTLSGYYFQFEPDSVSDVDKITLYSIANGILTKRGESPCLVPLPINQAFAVEIHQNGGNYTVYVNGALCAFFSDATITQDGYFGFGAYGNSGGGAVAYFDNARVPDMGGIKPQFAIEAYSSGKQALDRLIGKERIKYFARYDGALRIGRFIRRAVVDTYNARLFRTRRTTSGRYWKSHLRPQGQYYFADRWDAYLLANRGRRFGYENFTEAFTDAQAYADALYALRHLREMAFQYTLTSPAVPTAEIEDIVHVECARDETDQDMAIATHDIEFTLDDKRVTYSQTLTLRGFVDQ